MLIWCLKQFKDFILKLSMSGSFFPQRKFLNLYTMILSSFALGRYVDEVVAIKLSRIQVHLFPQYQTLKVLHFMNSEGFC